MAASIDCSCASNPYCEPIALISFSPVDTTRFHRDGAEGAACLGNSAAGFGGVFLRKCVGAEFFLFFFVVFLFTGDGSGAGSRKPPNGSDQSDEPSASGQD